MICQRKKQVYSCMETYSIRFRTVVSEVSFYDDDTGFPTKNESLETLLRLVYQFEVQRLRDFSNKVLEAIFIILQIL